MIDASTADLFRYAYAALAFLTCTGFVISLMLRWDALHVGERVLRIGLIAEHAVIIYAAYVALDLNYPPTLVGVGITMSLIAVVCGFALWIYAVICTDRDA